LFATTLRGSNKRAGTEVLPRSLFNKSGYTRDVCLKEKRRRNESRWRRCLRPEEQGLGLGTGEWMNINEVWWPCAWKPPSYTLDCITDVGLLFSCYAIFKNSDDELIISGRIQ